MEMMKNENGVWSLEASTEMVNRDKLDRVKFEDTQNGIASRPENKSDNDIDDYISSAAKNKRYELAEAQNAIKYIEHMVKNGKPIIDQNPAKPKDFDEWTKEQQYEHMIENLKTYVPSLPDSLLFFIRGALYRGDCGRNSTSKPPWLDTDKFRRGQKFARDYLFSIMFANMLSLFQIFSFTDGLKPLILSRQSHTPYLAFKRYLSTFRRLSNWMLEDPWIEGTQAHKDIQIVRRMHRAMRLKLCEHDNEEIDAATKIPNPWCPDREMILEDFSSCPYPTVENGCLHLTMKPKGLNQADMAATQFASSGIIMLYPREFGIHASDEDIAAFCHTWRVIGYLLGIEDEYNFCRGNLEETRQRGRDFIKCWVKPYLRQVTPEWEHMLRCITDTLSDYTGNDCFKLSLLFLTNLLNIDMPRLQSMLTYYQRLQFVLIHFTLRYAMKLRFVRECLNRLMHKIIDKSMDPKEDKIRKEKSAQKVPDFPASFSKFPILKRRE